MAARRGQGYGKGRDYSSPSLPTYLHLCLPAFSLTLPSNRPPTSERLRVVGGHEALDGRGPLALVDAGGGVGQGRHVMVLHAVIVVEPTRAQG